MCWIHRIDFVNAQQLIIPFSFRMKMKHVTHSSLHIPKGTVRDPPKGTHKEFASMKTSTFKDSKGKAIKCSVPGIGRLTSPEH